MRSEESYSPQSAALVVEVAYYAAWRHREAKADLEAEAEAAVDVSEPTLLQYLPPHGFPLCGEWALSARLPPQLPTALFAQPPAHVPAP